MLQRDRELPLRCCAAGDSTDWRAMDMLLFHVRDHLELTMGRLLTHHSMLLFLIFFPRNPQPSEMDEQDANIPTWKEAILVLAVSLAFFIVALFGSVIFVYAAPSHVRGWANFLGLLATSLAAVQYIPQIMMTWKLQETGSLSVPMMCIQTPGSFVFAASLAVRLGPGGWSAWGLFIFTGCLQGCLLAMSLWFIWRDKKAAKGTDEHVANGNGVGRSHEQTPLLHDDAQDR
jgi:hypothetical protein